MAFNNTVSVYNRYTATGQIPILKSDFTGVLRDVSNMQEYFATNSTVNKGKFSQLLLAYNATSTEVTATPATNIALMHLKSATQYSGTTSLSVVSSVSTSTNGVRAFIFTTLGYTYTGATTNSPSALRKHFFGYMFVTNVPSAGVHKAFYYKTISLVAHPGDDPNVTNSTKTFSNTIALGIQYYRTSISTTGFATGQRTIWDVPSDNGLSSHQFDVKWKFVGVDIDDD